MSRRLRYAWIPLLALAVSACADGGPAAPAEGFDLDGNEPLAAALPDLTPEAGSAGTDRYVPTLPRIFRRALRVVRERAGAEAAERLATEARAHREAVRVAREAGDTAAYHEAVRKLEGLQARVGVRVFGTDVVRHVHAEAGRRLRAVADQLQAAKDAGRDVSRLEAGAQRARRSLAAARDAAGQGRMGVALVHAAHALDLVIRIAAAL